ncbi:MAG: CDP-alcohol phosphatidyltransferase family protein, partial [Firmicutes bacterium]|nr:CDP-alcohol phosphatidyltransferase family protein [Bacillota bacterium]
MNLPNSITCARIVCVPIFVALYFLSGIWGDALRWAATALFLVAALTDFLDGYFARKRNQVTDMGKFLDPIADKLVVAAALFLIIWSNDAPAYQMYVIICAMAVTAREFTVAALRMVAASKNAVLAADKLG